MEQQFSLSWDAHKKNICSGLSSLQQNGEFVDMTLAADGHHVKVHKMIMALASPYIKEIISSTPCEHPVIFLNKISYTTLCSILEYIYTGEALVTKDKIGELVDAAKELHIKGLEDMKLELTQKSVVPTGLLAKHKRSEQGGEQTEDDDASLKKRFRGQESERTYQEDDSHVFDTADDIDSYEPDHDNTDIQTGDKPDATKQPTGTIQYTISNQGSIQMILNRYIYFLQYTSRTDTGHRNWLCVENRGNKCNASVITKGDVIVKRLRAHNHPFHDKKILKKVRDHAVYATINDAETLGKNKKKLNVKPTPEDNSINKG